MHILALETDIEKLKQAFMGKREEEVMTVHRHWLPFGFKLAQELLFGVGLIIASVFLNLGQLAATILFFAWILWICGGLLRAYVDWRYSFLFLTREKIVIVRQHLLRRRLLPITLNNIQSVEVISQYWDLLGFGKIIVHLQDSSEELVFQYVPDAQVIARKISNIVSLYNQRIGPWDGVKRTSAQTAEHHKSVALLM